MYPQLNWIQATNPYRSGAGAMTPLLLTESSLYWFDPCVSNFAAQGLWYKREVVKPYIKKMLGNTTNAVKRNHLTGIPGAPVKLTLVFSKVTSFAKLV